MSRKKIKLKSVDGGRKRVDLDSLPDRRLVERSLKRFAGGPDPSDPRDVAQEIIYDAIESRNVGERTRLARKALEIHPDCVDAQILLADEAPDFAARATILQWAVEAGERDLGPRYFKENAGHFWGLLETRPYMRARQSLAEALRALGKRKEAAAHYLEMLRLNPNDNQGVRSAVFPLLIELGRDDEATRLSEKYVEDHFASMTYCRALLAFRREGETTASGELLGVAIKANRFVPGYLTGRKAMPKTAPAYCKLGDDNEAVAAVSEMIEAWRATPGAMTWLAYHLEKRR